MTDVKICGLSTPEAVEAAQDADFIGFIFVPGSPRNISTDEASELAKLTQVPIVAVTVNPTDYQLHAITQAFRPAVIQLHGKESPVRVMRIKEMFKIPVIKAFQISTASDVLKTEVYEEIAEYFLFDTHLPFGMPGGTGKTFDWDLLNDLNFRKPWFLSGGLTVDNVEEAISVSGAKMVDVSSGVESAPGVKDPEKIRAFIKKVKSIQREIF